MSAVFTDAAPKPVGPYSQAIAHGELIFCSGQIALDPATGKLVPGGVEEQTQRVLQNLGAVLSAAGAGYGDVIKTTIFLVDMADFAAVNAVYAACFGETRPARTTVAVAALPLAARVEVEAIAVRP